MQTHALGTHQVTYDSVFQHPVAHNLQWREVRAMLEHVSDAVDDERGGTVKFTRNGKTLNVHPPKQKDFSDAAEVLRIRHFLKESEKGAVPDVAASDGHHLLVVIDHREARIFRAELHGTVPERVTPFDPEGVNRYLHAVGDDANGQRNPEPKQFYAAIARAVAGAEQILILGSSTGASSAMNHLVGELKQHHPAIAKHIVGAIVINETHLSENQMLAQARKFFSAEALPENAR